MSVQQDFIEQVGVDVIEEPENKQEKYSDVYYHRPSVVYFIAAGDTPIKAVKIGVTARDIVRQRLTGIQSANHERIRLLKVIEFLTGDKPGLQAENEEKRLHKQFASLCRAKAFTVGAEWFDWAQPLIEFVDDLPILPEDLRS